MRSILLALVAATGVVLSAQPASAQQVDDKYDFQPGDLVQFNGDGVYPPANSIFLVVRCEAPDEPYRECEMIRQSPDKEDHARPFTMNNYSRNMTLVGQAEAAEPGPAVAALPAAPAANPTPPPTGACPRSAYGGPVPGNRPASAALFRQKITDSITMAAYGPYWYGVRLENFAVGAPIRNNVSVVPGTGATRVSNGAPPGAMLYPVSTTMSVCEGAPTSSSDWRTSAKKYLCFVSKENEWTCGASN